MPAAAQEEMLAPLMVWRREEVFFCAACANGQAVHPAAPKNQMQSADKRLRTDTESRSRSLPDSGR
jgi:hypothetical protein